MTLGVPIDGSVGFVWDNEGPPAAPQSVAGFAVAPQPVSVADFYLFAVTERGYEDPAWWQDEDLQHLSKTGQVLCGRVLCTSVASLSTVLRLASLWASVT